jgi:hypothetical protein
VLSYVLVNNKHQQNNMKTLQEDKSPDKTKKTGEVRMGREVSSKRASDCDSGKNTECSDKKKEEAREDRASSLV